jgi:hypothetical protein
MVGILKRRDVAMPLRVNVSEVSCLKHQYSSRPQPLRHPGKFGDRGTEMARDIAVVNHIELTVQESLVNRFRFTLDSETSNPFSLNGVRLNRVGSAASFNCLIEEESGPRTDFQQVATARVTLQQSQRMTSAQSLVKFIRCESGCIGMRRVVPVKVGDLLGRRTGRNVNQPASFALATVPSVLGYDYGVRDTARRTEDTADCLHDE